MLEDKQVYVLTKWKKVTRKQVLLRYVTQISGSIEMGVLKRRTQFCCERLW